MFKVVALIMCYIFFMVNVFGALTNSLFINNRYFDNVKPLAAGMDVATAKEICKDNGVDEIFFKDQDGKLYVAYATGQSFDGIKSKYIGRYQDKKVQVVDVDDEMNTAKEGVKSVFTSIGNTFSKVLGDEFSKTLSAVVTTATGGVVAAFALKSGAASAAAATAGGAAATGAAAVGIKATLLGFASTIAAPVAAVAIGGAVLTAGFCAVQAVRGARKRSNLYTIDMITDQQFEDMDLQSDKPIDNLVAKIKNEREETIKRLKVDVETKYKEYIEITSDPNHDPNEAKKVYDEYLVLREKLQKLINEDIEMNNINASVDNTSFDEKPIEDSNTQPIQNTGF